MVALCFDKLICSSTCSHFSLWNINRRVHSLKSSSRSRTCGWFPCGGLKRGSLCDESCCLEISSLSTERRVIWSWSSDLLTLVYSSWTYLNCWCFFFRCLLELGSIQVAFYFICLIYFLLYFYCTVWDFLNVIQYFMFSFILSYNLQHFCIAWGTLHFLLIQFSLCFKLFYYIFYGVFTFLCRTYFLFLFITFFLLFTGKKLTVNVCLNMSPCIMSLLQVHFIYLLISTFINILFLSSINFGPVCIAKSFWTKLDIKTSFVLKALVCY